MASKNLLSLSISIRVRRPRLCAALFFLRLDRLAWRWCISVDCTWGEAAA